MKMQAPQMKTVLCLGAVPRRGKKVEEEEEERTQLQGKQMAATRGSFEEPA